MCSIAGMINLHKNYLYYKSYNSLVVRDMAQSMTHRGPDANGEWVGEHAAFAHTRLSVIDPLGGAQPMSRTVDGYEFVITYNGELYNADDLRKILSSHGYSFTTTSDTEVLLFAYIHFGEKCAELLNGIYAFCIWDSMRQRVFACRDRFGVKPFFYTVIGNTVLFSSEIKGLFRHPSFTAAVDKEGLQELFAISPARTQGIGVFKDVLELKPAHFMIIDRSGLKISPYWELKSHEHTDSYEDTISTVRQLVCDSITRQLVSDVPIGTLLSGGLDSSIISAVAALHFKEQGKQLSTYSFDYVNNDKYFKASAFQPDADRPWVERMVEEFNTDHTFLECDNGELIDYLIEAMRYKDLPGMADVDASLLYFCREIKKHHTVILSGECSDEIFGGYPWFRSEKAFNTPAFPWSYDMSLRNSILKPQVAQTLDLEGYSRTRYDQSIAQVPTFDGDSAEEKRRREIAYLNLNWFMTNLLDRKDRMSMASGLEVRVPFCDHRIVEYVWNVPWEMKNRDNISKSLLREAVRGILPDDVLYRKKSPYPKTHNPKYEKMVKAMLLDIIANPNAPILTFADKSVLEKLCTKDSDYGKPFFGQLMAEPQFVGYLIQLNAWFEEYRIRIL